LFLAAEWCAATPVRAPEDARPGYFAVSSGAPRTLRQLVDLLGELAGRPVPVEWGARPDRAGDMLELWAAGPPVPGWAPEITLERGLTGVLERAGVARP
jgi:nucleoside-diphosphate-sugar epimerase